jgi:hypothetical protein
LSFWGVFFFFTGVNVKLLGQDVNGPLTLHDMRVKNFSKTAVSKLQLLEQLLAQKSIFFIFGCVSFNRALLVLISKNPLRFRLIGDRRRRFGQRDRGKGEH